MHNLHIVAVGAFGEAVAKEVAVHLEDVVITKEEGGTGLFYPSKWPHAKIQAMISWRPNNTLFELMEELSLVWNVPFLPMLMDSPRLQLGPVVVKGTEGCYTCFQKRQLQHSVFAEYLKPIREFYQRFPEAGPKGYLPVHVKLAAAWFIDLVQRVQQDPLAEAGRVYEMDLINGGFQKGHVLGFHGCPHCGIEQNESERSYVHLLKMYDSVLA